MRKKRQKSEAGFSIAELLVVLVVMSIMTTVTGYYLLAHQKLYKPDQQSLKILDILQEARQRSLTQRETMRVEINLTAGVVKLYDENTPTTASDDREIKSLTLLPQTEVIMAQRPNNIGYNPPEALPAPTAVFTSSVYPTSTSQNVCTLRFQSNGTVVNAGTNATGTGSTITGASIHIWAPKKSAPTDSDIARSITVTGSTGSIRFWEYDSNSTATNKWRDSRRANAY